MEIISKTMLEVHLHDGRRMAINPAAIQCVTEQSDGSCGIYFSPNDGIENIEEGYEAVIDLLNSLGESPKYMAANNK